ATETLKVLLEIGDPLVGRLLIYDALDATFHELKLRRDPACPACGEGSQGGAADRPARTQASADSTPALASV
ncbi:MAG: hypothetical protein ACR2JZ_01240, partial [Candidatus Limnocylindrales bacterium]